MRMRTARLSDTPAIHRLISHYAPNGSLLPRPESEIQACVDRFFVGQLGSCLAACGALEMYRGGLAEIRSLAVQPELQGGGLGGRLVGFILGRARRLGIARVFAVTQSPEFFLRLGFESSTRNAVPEKMTRDCVHCSRSRHCRLAVLMFTVCRPSVLEVLEPVAVA